MVAAILRAWEFLKRLDQSASAALVAWMDNRAAILRERTESHLPHGLTCPECGQDKGMVAWFIGDRITEMHQHEIQCLNCPHVWVVWCEGIDLTRRGQ